MGFRESLDLSGIADQYEAFNPRGFRQAAPGAQISDSRLHQPSGDATVPAYVSRPAPLPGEGDHPGRVGTGPIRASARRTVACARLSFGWDPNRYYRDLGISWPYVHASRRLLREAYIERGGQDSARLTYCFKQLLNPELRAYYDALPLGERLIDDYVAQSLKEEALRRVRDRLLRDGVEISAEEALDEMGFVVHKDESHGLDDGVESGVDNDQFNQFNEDVHPALSGADSWQYSYYLWKTRRVEPARLQAWQSALISALDLREGPVVEVAVGLMGGQPHRYAVGWTDDGWVVFLSDTEDASPEIASSAVQALQEQISANATRALDRG